MRQDGNSELLRGPHGGKTCITALGKDKIRAGLFHHAESLPFRRNKPERDRQIFRGQRSYELGTIDKEIGASERGEQASFNAIRAHVCKLI